MSVMMGAGDIGRALADRIEALCVTLLPKGRRQGAEWRCGSIDGEPGGSLGVHLRGPKAGIWSDFATDEAGDALDLVAAVLCLDMRGAIAWSRDWLGGMAALRTLRVAPCVRRSDAVTVDIARLVWREAVNISGTLGERYLRERRYIDLEPLPSTVRFHAGLVYGPKRDGIIFPGIVCPVQDADGTFSGIWRIFLDPNTADKAPVVSPRMGLGSIVGGAVRLTPISDELVLGIETCLAVLCADSERRCWAGLSASLMRQLMLPAQVRRVVLLEENDKPDQHCRRATSDAVRELGRRLSAEGRAVRVVRSPAEFKDFNLGPGMGRVGGGNGRLANRASRAPPHRGSRSMKIISADERLAQQRGVKALIVGPSGVGKTSLLRSLNPERTLFVDIEAGDLAVQDVPADTIRINDWPTARDLACCIGGPNPSFPSTACYSEAHYQAIGGALEHLDCYDTIFVDSVTAVSRLSFRWAEQQPESFSERTGNKDTRTAYGLHGREMINWLHQLQHARGKSVIFVAILEKVVDEFNRTEFQVQMEGAKTGRELPGIVDQIMTMQWINFGDGKPLLRAFVCTSPNPWGYPAKDRSGRLEQIEEPHLGKLIAKLMTPQQRKPFAVLPPQQ
jgi:hypothetical protein